MNLLHLNSNVTINGVSGIVTKIGNEKIVGTSIPYVIVDRTRINITDIIEIQFYN